MQNKLQGQFSNLEQMTAQLLLAAANRNLLEQRLLSILLNSQQSQPDLLAKLNPVDCIVP